MRSKVTFVDSHSLLHRRLTADNRQASKCQQFPIWVFFLIRYFFFLPKICYFGFFHSYNFSVFLWLLCCRKCCCCLLAVYFTFNEKNNARFHKDNNNKTTTKKRIRKQAQPRNDRQRGNSIQEKKSKKTCKIHKRQQKLHV